MKKELAVFALCGVMLVSSQVALAQYRPGPPPPPPPGKYHGMYDQGRHEGWYKRGGHIPPEYRRGSYVVSDWQRYRLKPPPRGYQYVRSDNGDFLLAAITTGAILSIVAASQ
ncbi:RcnB family protein [Dyella acidiphila]|uniref:RcnB family protein n=1 Tax=Dyella acidiphila TaxID=2775866 RepID=A0ABR9G7D3_9GAMM|nr:RcnB family protein [Dyella acidiphila]MBE1159964.1 RcnB family protein [Dyella acidiphila]